MKNKQVAETKLFRKLNILLLDKNKEHLEELKEKISLLANVEIDNSGFIRGMIEYLYDHQGELGNLVEYVKEYKGYSILDRFEKMVEANASFKQIEKEIGIGIAILKNLAKERQSPEKSE